jgi:hypothetical protein
LDEASTHFGEAILSKITVKAINYGLSLSKADIQSRKPNEALSHSIGMVPLSGIESQ